MFEVWKHYETSKLVAYVNCCYLCQHMNTNNHCCCINIDLCLLLHTICDTAANEYMQLAFRLDAIIW